MTNPIAHAYAFLKERLCGERLVPYSGPEYGPIDRGAADYTLRARFWGYAIHWLFPEKIPSIDLNQDHRIRVSGVWTPRPKVGQTLLAEMESSWILFEFLSVEYCRDPRDMFFADVRAVRREMKAPAAAGGEP